MGFKPFAIDHSKKNDELDPLQIFDSLTLRGSVNNLWGPQIDALRKWDAVRTAPDVSIEMNTGGGKTLVGLLVATSLARELHKMVLYVCPTIQLIQQTAAKAKECSIEVATYYSHNWEGADVAEAAIGPCLTTHQAVFNGLSTFRDKEIGAVVLDDAHAASAIVRDHFTLKLPRTGDAYRPVVDLFRQHFRYASLEMAFDEVTSGTTRELLFVPLHVSSKLAVQVREKLVRDAVSERSDTKFVWAHLKDRLDRCVFLLGSDRIEIAPACLPTDLTPPFRKGVRRVYLTATLPSPTEFFRTFGTVPVRVTPDGRSGEAQRAFLNTGGGTDEEQRDSAKALLKDRKAFILAPSGWIAQKWSDCAGVFAKEDDHRRIEIFAGADPPEKLAMGGRYDGVDLPGDACRILVLDGLPSGEALLPRYIGESLRVETVRASTAAMRIVQAVGRIFRSNTDHGAVVLVGKALRRWLDSPFNRGFLPPLLQRQFELAAAIDKKIMAGEFTASDVIDAVLDGEREWDEFYKENIGQFSTTPPQRPPEWLAEAIQKEQAAHRMMWDNNFADAASEYAGLAADTDPNDPDLAAWYRHFEGYCYERASKPDLALSAYTRAANRRASLGRPRTASSGKLAPVRGGASGQAERVARLVRTEGSRALVLARSLQENLVYSDSPNRAEQAVHDLGRLLGLESSRPDHDAKKARTAVKAGPDVLWLAPDAPVGHAFEAKTDKKADGTYNKDDIGQAHNHRKWLQDNHPEKSVPLSFLGRFLAVSPQASPDDGLTVLEVPPFRELAGQVIKLYDQLTSASADADITEAWLRHLGLKFPACVEAMPRKTATDLQDYRTGV